MFNKFKPDPKPEKKAKVKKAYRYKRKPTGEKQVFKTIWDESPHASQIGGVDIIDPTPTNFLHVLPKAKNKYPKFKLNPQNIILGTVYEHYVWDHKRSLATGPEWKFMFELEESLKKQYIIKHG